MKRLPDTCLCLEPGHCSRILPAEPGFYPDPDLVPPFLLEDVRMGYEVQLREPEDPHWRQLVTYVLVREECRERYLTFRRKPPGVDAGPGLWSLALDGLIGKYELADPWATTDVLVCSLLAAERSVQHQLALQGPVCCELIGFVTAPEDNRLGLVYKGHVLPQQRKCYAPWLHEPYFAEPAAMMPQVLEPWSKAIFDALLAPMVR